MCVAKGQQICFSTNKLVGRRNLSTSRVIDGWNEIMAQVAYFPLSRKGNPLSDSFLDKWIDRKIFLKNNTFFNMWQTMLCGTTECFVSANGVAPLFREMNRHRKAEKLIMRTMTKITLSCALIPFIFMKL